MGKRILIIDDEKWICSVLQDYLEESGYDVKTAPSLSGARDQIGNTDLPDAIVLDMSLPDGSGISLVEEFRANERTKDIPILLMTAHTLQKIEESTVVIQPEDCILKPFNLRDVRDRLERQLNPAT
jgi:DNA-binding response OmpR family regulator